jgi:hypothetical protein
MDPISLIVAAPAAGASAAVKDTASQAVKDAYGALKALLRNRLGGDPRSEAELDRVEQRPDADPQALKQPLRAVGAERDEELIRTARDLLVLVDPDGAGRGKYDVRISGGKGIVVGDHSTVTMNFGDE